MCVFMGLVPESNKWLIDWLIDKPNGILIVLQASCTTIAQNSEISIADIIFGACSIMRWLIKPASYMIRGGIIHKTSQIKLSRAVTCMHIGPCTSHARFILLRTKHRPTGHGQNVSAGSRPCLGLIRTTNSQYVFWVWGHVLYDACMDVSGWTALAFAGFPIDSCIFNARRLDVVFVLASLADSWLRAIQPINQSII